MNSNSMYTQIAVFEPSGYISAANAQELEQKLTAAVTSKDCSVFLVDMGEVEFIDSAGLMVILSAVRSAQELGKRLVICSIAPSVRIILELTGLDRALDIFENRRALELAMPTPVAA